MLARALAAFAIGTLAGMVSSETAHGVRKGFAAYYERPGHLEAIARKRGLHVEHPVASPWEPIGTRLQVCSKRGCIVAVVADVCHPRDCASIRRRGITIELSHADNGKICGLYNHPPRYCVVTVSKGG